MCDEGDVVRIDSERDIEVLRQAAQILDSENRRLIEKNVELTRKLLEVQGLDQGKLQLKLVELKEQLERRSQELFGDSSERRHRTRDDGAPPRQQQRGHGPRPQPQLPLVDVVHTLDVGDTKCPQCGGELAPWEGQFEESEEVDVVERHFVLKKHKRQKYRCSCNAWIETAPAPLKLTPGGRYSLDFAIEVAVGKYGDHLPLERQAEIMAREGLVIDSQTLWDQIEALARVVAPLHARLHERVLAAPVIHADETYWRLMKGRGAKAAEDGKWYVWSVCCDDAVDYRLLGGRGKESAREVLGTYHGTVVADGYGVYAALARDGPGYRLAGCWAHVRRKFVEAESSAPEPCGAALEMIGELYGVEREAAGDGAEAGARRTRLRAERARPVLERLHAWALDEAARTLPQSGLGKALRYMLDLWPALTVFVEDARVPIDNNPVERGLRGVVLGRKNHYGSRSKRGTEVAALFYSVIETCKLVGIDPKAYLRASALAALREDAAYPLPHEIAVAPVPAQQ